MNQHDVLFDDCDDDDAATPGDERLTFDGVDDLQAMFDAVHAISDPDRRVDAAKALVAGLNGE